jgi:hypothetical protein
MFQMVSNTVEHVNWNELGPEFLKTWGNANGKFMPEHLAILGPTGSGKSFFMTQVLQQRATLRGSHVVILATKPADGTLTKLGWPIINKWPPKYDQSQVIFWPKAGNLNESLDKQREAVLGMLNELWHANSNIILSFDEIAYIEEDLKLKTQITRYWREARALGITIVATTQRPRFVSRYMWSESSWTVAFRPKDEEDAEQVATVLGNRKYFKPVLMEQLQKNEFIILNRDERQAYISKIIPVKTTSSGTGTGLITPKPL